MDVRRRPTAFLTVGALGSIAVAACFSFGLISSTEEASGWVRSGRAESDRVHEKPAERDRRLRFAVIGDHGSGDAHQARVARGMCAQHKRAPFDLVVTTGDNVYPAGERKDFQDAFFRPYSCLLKRGVPWHVTLGNHDYRTNRGLPEIREPAFGMKGRNYVIRKSGVRFVMADSNELDTKWLEGATKARPGDRWTVVVFHHPVYSPSSEHGSTAGLRPSLPNLFRRREVDLVLNGHDHIYSVSKKLRKIKYVVTGGGGRELYSCAPASFSSICAERHHFLVVRTGPKRIRVKAYPPSGRAFHAFETAGRS